MKSRAQILCTIAFLTAISHAEASVLYGSTSAGGPGELWTIDPTTGAGVLDIGPLDDSLGTNYAVTGLAFDPNSGVLYGSTGGRSGTLLLTINPVSALVTVVGSFNAGAGNTMADISFDSSGNLYGIGSSAKAGLFSINEATGQATAIGPSGLAFTQGGGLAISADGVFYGTPIASDFGTYDPITGAFTDIANPPRPGGSGTSYASLAFDGNTLYAMNLASPTHLVTIDSMGNVTDIGTSVPLIDGIAFQPVPEPGALALIGLGFSAVLLRASRRTGVRS